MTYIYAITCESKINGNQQIHGDCYENIEQALDFVSRQSDKPQSFENPLIWSSSEYIYKIHVLTLAEPQKRPQSRKLENL